ncbi:hypothetical protein [Sediminicola sp. 1XM1-17]|uniref:hypothetical protein n=1 Tax=Sediminicola sp. 1XM1-17 TaxID=3127702 RepID=UPI0030769C92
MKKIKSILIAAMLLTVGNVLANDLELTERSIVDPENNLTLQIGEMLMDNSFVYNGKDLLAEVRFTLNRQSEIVVLSVMTEEGPMESFVKSKLNYQKVSQSGFEEGKIFTVQVRVCQ